MNVVCRHDWLLQCQASLSQASQLNKTQLQETVLAGTVVTLGQFYGWQKGR